MKRKASGLKSDEEECQELLRKLWIAARRDSLVSSSFHESQQHSGSSGEWVHPSTRETGLSRFSHYSTSSLYYRVKHASQYRDHRETTSRATAVGVVDGSHDILVAPMQPPVRTHSSQASNFLDRYIFRLPAPTGCAACG